LFGGFQQSGIRPGTEPAALCLGLQTALERWETQAEERYANVSNLRDRLESGLLAAGIGAVVNGADAERLPHTSCISFPGLDRQAIFLALDQAGVACSTGSACASGSSEPSPVLLAMGLSKRIVDSALRFSLAMDTTATEIDRAIERISPLIKDLRRSKSP
jgi:cysteine desulfurase